MEEEVDEERQTSEDKDSGFLERLPCQIESFAYTANADGNNNVRAEVISEMSGLGLARNSG